jgi:L-glyceraldehyde 3-phosphate reductase
MTSALTGASNIARLEADVAALSAAPLNDGALTAIEAALATEPG